MTVQSAQSIVQLFTTRVFATGVGTNADSLPTGTLYLNGAANGATVTVTNITTGLYKAAVTLPTLAIDDEVELIITATVSTITDKAVIWGDSKDILVDGSGDVTFNNTSIATVTSVTNAVTANTTQLAGQTVSAAAGVTFPASVASPTNITAGTITTTTNLTNAPTAGDFTAAMKTSLNASTPASIQGSVASVTGNVGGSVASVTAAVAVGSIQGAASNFKKNQALANFEFVMTDSTTHQTKTGLTVTAQRSLDGAAFANCANSVSELSNGVYVISLAAGDLNANVVTFRFTATNADDKLVTIVTQP